ncbi:hypothetical protein J4438_00825 [Candidatus Woesearchaeota archaeon]|nr:hypothetical protein [Candidatus Woesearchaeota archaeon]
MKKIFALLILSLLLFSVAPIDARQGERGEWEEKVIEDYKQATERYQTNLERWNEVKEDYQWAKEKVKRINDISDVDKSKAIERIDIFLSRTLDRMDSHLDILTAWAEKINITEERRAQILEDIENKRAELNEFRNEIDSAATIEELRAISKDIKESWNGFVPSVKRISGELLTQRIGLIIESSEELSVEMHAKLDNLSQNDSEVQEMQGILDDYDEKITLAKEQYELAKDVYEQIENDSESATSLFEQTKEYLQKSREYLKEAHQILKELVKDYREFTNVAIIDDDEDEENETDDENESEDDSDDENETENDLNEENETDDENESEENETED